MTTANGTARDPRPDLLLNALLTRTLLWDRLRGPTAAQDYDAQCGYPPGPHAADFYQDLYDHDPIARRVVEAWPRACWQVQPVLYEDEELATQTPFEEAWAGLSQQLRGEESAYEQEDGSLISEILFRADIACGIGRFGLVLLGLDDGAELSRPAVPRAGQRLLYLRVFPESLVEIKTWETRLNNPRYGQPTVYTIQLADVEQTVGATVAPFHQRIDVHWTRVLHCADNVTTSEVFGTPRLQPVLHRILDLRKLYSGSAAMYWLGAFPGLSLETHPQMGGDVQLDEEAMRDMMTDYAAGLQRYLALKGMSANSLAPQVVDPTPQIAVQLQAIAVALEMPQRKLLGSERGELASSQDDDDFNDDARNRQEHQITPRLIILLADRLIWLGVLPRPRQYRVWWPDLASEPALQAAQVAAQKTAALAQYVQSGAEQLVPPLDYLTRFLGLAEEEAAAILENAMNVEEEDQPPPEEEEEDDEDEEEEDEATPLPTAPEEDADAVLRP